MTKPLVLPRPGRHANARQPLGRDRARRLIKELNALHEIGRAISRAWHLSDVLETIYVQTSRLMDTRHLYIALYHADRNIIEFALARENGKRVDWPPRKWDSGRLCSISHSVSPVPHWRGGHSTRLPSSRARANSIMLRSAW